MKKLFGIEAEINITADDDVVKGIGAGIKSGSIVISDIVKEAKPVIVNKIKDTFNKDEKKEEMK